MTLESFETTMRKNDRTLAPGQEGSKMDTAATSRRRNASKYNINAMLASTFFMMLCFCLLSNAGAASLRKERAIASLAIESTTAPTKECHQNTPCGWAIYIPFTRRIDYFMKNTCICNSSLACLKTDDDLSVNAYVYRCKVRPVTTTEIIPTTI
ncbi:uncharacterized protein LOC112596004 [Melanaphis sacchari]|uniref:uncharacterized protein LOC112596004 n=1 Tax=Melanaphis sacchari TaxID=742174 RepID=UPI000DC13065|nr:uncharacterized protein LOC112596004 [Melanaphis sacchari]